MKILLITNEFYPKLGGIANVLTNLYKFFPNEEHKLYVINAISKGKNLFNLLIDNEYTLKDFLHFILKKRFLIFSVLSFWKIIKDGKIPFSQRLKLILYFFSKPKVWLKVIENTYKLYPFLKKLNFDLILAGHSGWILPLIFILSRFFNKKIVSIAYGLDFLVSNPLSLKTYFFKNADKIILITEKTKELIKKIHHLNENQLEVIYVGINLEDLEIKESKEELRKKYNLSNKTFVLLSVGRHVERKNFNLAIKAVAEIKKLRPSILIKYFLIGEGPETINLKALSNELNLKDDVIFLGSCNLEQRNHFYKLSDIFLMPSITKKNDLEGFGIVFLEANYFKIPVIGTATGGMVEAIINGETGFLIRQNDLHDLVEKILFLYDNQTIRERFGENGHTRAIKKFNWENLVKSYINLFEKLLSNKFEKNLI